MKRLRGYWHYWCWMRWWIAEMRLREPELHRSQYRALWLHYRDQHIDRETGMLRIPPYREVR